jgi:hypothetical protein
MYVHMTCRGVVLGLPRHSFHCLSYFFSITLQRVAERSFYIVLKTDSCSKYIALLGNVTHELARCSLYTFEEQALVAVRRSEASGAFATSTFTENT